MREAWHPFAGVPVQDQSNKFGGTPQEQHKLVESADLDTVSLISLDEERFCEEPHRGPAQEVVVHVEDRSPAVGRRPTSGQGIATS